MTSTWSTVPAKAGAVFRRQLDRAQRTLATRRSAPPRLIRTAAPDDLRRAIPRPSDRTLLRTSGWAMTIFAGLILGLLVHIVFISGLSEHRQQSLLFEQFRGQLAYGTAPIGQVGTDGQLLPPGSPVSLLSIPAAGVTDAVVVEGTTSSDLEAGPGHRRDTPLPGQVGVSVVYGRQFAYGGPFGQISTLAVGDTITTTTGQGPATYRVVDVRYAGDAAPPMPSNGSRLTLVSLRGVPFLGSDVVRIDADLVGKAQPTPQPVLRPGTLAASEDPLASDPSGWLPMFLLLELALVVGVLMILALRRWGRFHTWIVGVPVIIAVGGALAREILVVLPNLY